MPRNPQYRSLDLDSSATVGSLAGESRRRVRPAFRWLRTAAWTSLFTARKARLARAFLETSDPPVVDPGAFPRQEVGQEISRHGKAGQGEPLSHPDAQSLVGGERRAVAHRPRRLRVRVLASVGRRRADPRDAEGKPGVGGEGTAVAGGDPERAAPQSIPTAPPRIRPALPRIPTARRRGTGTRRRGPAPSPASGGGVAQPEHPMAAVRPRVAPRPGHPVDLGIRARQAAIRACKRNVRKP